MPLPSEPEFRRYRLTLGAIVFGATAIAVAWLATSVGWALFARPAPSVTGRFSGNAEDLDAQLACHHDVRALLDDLAVRQAPPTPGGDDWQALSDEWDRRWREVGARCRFEELRDRGLGESFDHLARAHAELPEVHRGYAALLKSYYAHQQTRVEDLRRALETSQRTIERARARRGLPHAG